MYGILIRIRAIYRRSDHEGYLLLEMLLGFAVLSVVSLLMGAILNGGIQIYKRYGSQNGLWRGAIGPLERMQKELENMVYFDFSRSSVVARSFQGALDNVAFLVATDKGLRVIRYFLLPQEKTLFYSLVRQEVDFADYVSRNYDHQKGIRVLSRDVIKDSLRFLYGARIADKEYPYALIDQWTFERAPAFIQIRMKTAFQGKVEEWRKNVFIPSGYIGGQENAR